MSDPKQASPSPGNDAQQEEEDALAEAMDILSQTSPEEIEAMSQMGDDDETDDLFDPDHLQVDIDEEEHKDEEKTDKESSENAKEGILDKAKDPDQDEPKEETPDSKEEGGSKDGELTNAIDDDTKETLSDEAAKAAVAEAEGDDSPSRGSTIRTSSNPRLSLGLKKIATMDEGAAKVVRSKDKDLETIATRRQTMNDALMRKQALMTASSHSKNQRRLSDRSLSSNASDDTPIARNSTGSANFIQEAASEEELEEYKERVDDLLQQYFGFNMDDEKSFEELGMNSARKVEFTNQVAKSLGVNLPYNHLSDYTPTPATFRSYAVSRMAKKQSIPVPNVTRKSAFPKKMDPKYKMRWAKLGIIQAALSIVLLLLCTVSLVPLWFMYDFLVGHEMLSLMVPLYFMFSTAVVVATKWIVVGRYKAATIHVPSTLYLRWWFVDRLIHIWEVWVGRFLLDTPWLAWVYVLMGAKVSLSCNLKGFVREFDLITMEKYATLDYPCTRARTFIRWAVKERGPTMILRPIFIGKKSKVRGMLMPGASVGKRVWVDRLSVVGEGAHIPDKQSVAGNPAVITGPAPAMRYYGWGLVGALKTLWMFLDLWLFYALARFSDWVTQKCAGEVAGWGDWLGAGNRDHWIYRWTGVRAVNAQSQDLTIWYFLSFLIVYSLSMLLSSVVIKFLIIGYRHPGRAREYFWQNFVDWAADYHFSLAILLHQIVASHSRVSNIILMMHGMQIDMASKVDIASFKPSQLDLIRLRKSYAQHCTFDVKKDGEFRRITLKECSIGHGANIGAGVIAQSAVIAPMSFVTDNIEEREMIHTNDLVNSWALYGHELINLLLYGLFIMFFYASLLPAYEYWMFFFNDASAAGAWLAASGTLVVLAYTWLLVFLILQFIALYGVSEERPHPWSMSFYNVYQSFLVTFQEWTIAWHILYGTQLFNDLLRLLGIHVHGRALLFPHRFFDFSLLTIGDKTVIDAGSIISANNIVYDHVQLLAPTFVSGLIHDGSVIMANAVVTSQHTGPWRAKLLSSQGFDVAPTEEFNDARVIRPQSLVTPRTELV